MKRQPICHALKRVVSTSLFASLLGVCTVQAGEIRVGGTGNALGTMRLLADAFMRKQPAAQVVVLESIGTSGAIKAVPKGALDIGLSSRPLTDAELAPGMAELEYARTPTVVAVSSSSSVKSIAIAQLADIYIGKFSKWPDGTLVRPVMRQPGDDNTRQLRELSPLLAAALLEADKRQGLPSAVNDQEATEKIESIPGAVGVTALSTILSEKRKLRPLQLDGVDPTVENAAAGKYPVAKRFFLITLQAPRPEVGEFMAFVRSSAGREILTRNGHWIP